MSVKISGWTIHAHDCFISQLEALTVIVEQQKKTDPEGYQTKFHAQLLASIYTLMTVEIPSNPASKSHEQSNTLGKTLSWRRTKFNEQFRMFFQFDSRQAELVYACVHDSTTLCGGRSENHPYADFAKLISSGIPPDSWTELVQASAALDDEPDALTSTGAEQVG